MNERITVPVAFHRVLFEFTSLDDWAARARRLFARCGVAASQAVCLDAAGRVCTHGTHFHRAEREGRYPITVYAIDPPPKKDPPTRCRRCSECPDNSHHWMPDPHPTKRGDHCCKHCPQRGDTCDDCDGEGCESCRWEGVLPV